ncbi:MAG: LapA family protein [Rhodospirillales bacterium]|nr:DUF1049 domain-containing protein [Rhodospirillales bacterium]MDE2457720.1 LapA family protein [Rhodospirillales bacterium]
MIGFLIVLVLVVFVLSNRVPVLIGFWPFGTASAWLGPIVIGALALGFFIGLLVGVPKQFHWRRRARTAEKHLAELCVPPGNIQPSAAQPAVLK